MGRLRLPGRLRQVMDCLAIVMPGEDSLVGKRCRGPDDKGPGHHLTWHRRHALPFTREEAQWILRLNPAVHDQIGP